MLLVTEHTNTTVLLTSGCQTGAAKNSEKNILRPFHEKASPAMKLVLIPKLTWGAQEWCPRKREQANGLSSYRTSSIAAACPTSLGLEGGGSGRPPLRNGLVRGLDGGLDGGGDDGKANRKAESFDDERRGVVAVLFGSLLALVGLCGVCSKQKRNELQYKHLFIYVTHEACLLTQNLSRAFATFLLHLQRI